MQRVKCLHQKAATLINRTPKHIVILRPATSIAPSPVCYPNRRPVSGAGLSISKIYLMTAMKTIETSN
jgi:hypothetical protein